MTPTHTSPPSTPPAVRHGALSRGRPGVSPLVLRALLIALGGLFLAGIGVVSERLAPHAPSNSAESPDTASLAASVQHAELGLGAGDWLAGAQALPAAVQPSEASAGSGSAAATASVSAATDGQPKVILNTATADELRRLPGVGPRRAEQILELRQKLGRFRKITDLLRVKGIGPKSLKRMMPLVLLDPPPAPATS